MPRASAPLGLMSILDQLFPQVSLALAAPRAAAFVEQVGGKLDGQPPCRFDHRIEPRDGIALAGEHEKEAEACDRGVVEVIEIERPRLREARHAEAFAVRAELPVKDGVSSVLEPGTAQRRDGALGRQLAITWNQAQRNDSVRPGPRLLLLGNSFDERRRLRR